MTQLVGAPPQEPEAYSAEEVAAAKIQARELMAKNPLVSGAAQAMVLFRRAYGVAHLALKREVLEAKAGLACVDAIAEAMRELAGQGFSIDAVIRQMGDLGIPLLAAENRRLDEADAAAQKKLMEKAEDVRRGLPVGLGFEWSKDTHSLPRDKPLVLHGHPKALWLCLKHLVELVDGGVRAEHVLHLTGGVFTSQYNRRRPSYVSVAFGQWHGIAKTQTNYERFLSGWCNVIKSGRIDLVLIDDLTKLQKPVITGAEPIRSAPAALKIARTAFEILGAGLVACIPSSDKLPVEAEVDASVWKNLRRHAHVLTIKLVPVVEVEPPFDGYSLQIGDFAEMKVPKILVDGEAE